MARLVIFDMDGLLIDSEPLWVRAEMEVFARAGVELREEDCAQTKGLRVDDVVSYWHRHRGFTSGTPAEVEANLVARVAELVRAEGRALPGVAAAIAAARLDDRRLALASSSPSPIIAAALERLGLEKAFDAVRSAESLPFGKPHPAIFLDVAEHLGAHPLDTIVLEDSMNGVLAAKSARMICIAVPEAHPNHDPRFVIADVVVDSLEAVDAALFERLSGSRSGTPSSA